MDQDGWKQHSMLVLDKLQSMSDNISRLHTEIQELKIELVEMRAKEGRVVEVLKWKTRIDEIASPTQLKEMKDELENLKSFKTKAITVFTVVQGAMGFAMWFLDYLQG